MIGKVKGKPLVVTANGNGIGSDAANILKNVDAGTKVFIDAKINGPDGKIHSCTVGIKAVR